MFITDLMDEFNRGVSPHFQSQVKIWKRAETTQPYFQLIEKRSVGESVEDVVVFISDPYDLRRTIRTATGASKEAQTSVIVSTPGSINGSGAWSQDVLKIMYLGVHKIRHEFSFIYVTDRGVFGQDLDGDLGMYVKEILYIAPGQAVNLFDYDICRIGC